MKKINLKKYLTKKIIISALIVTVVLLSLILMIIKKIDLKYEDTVKYEGKTYYLLEYNQDVFTYNFYYNGYLEEELVQPIKHDTWDIVYLNGDLFLPKKEVKKAIIISKTIIDDQNIKDSFKDLDFTITNIK